MSPIRAVWFDVGEVLTNETGEYGTWADWLGIPRHARRSLARGYDPLDHCPHQQVRQQRSSVREDRRARVVPGIRAEVCASWRVHAPQLAKQRSKTSIWYRNPISFARRSLSAAAEDAWSRWGVAWQTLQLGARRFYWYLRAWMGSSRAAR